MFSRKRASGSRWEMRGAEGAKLGVRSVSVNAEGVRQEQGGYRASCDSDT